MNVTQDVCLKFFKQKTFLILHDEKDTRRRRRIRVKIPLESAGAQLFNGEKRVYYASRSKTRGQLTTQIEFPFDIREFGRHRIYI